MQVDELTYKIYLAYLSNGRAIHISSCYLQAIEIKKYVEEKEFERMKKAEGRLPYDETTTRS